jgi:hypothetical protein
VLARQVFEALGLCTSESHLYMVARRAEEKWWRWCPASTSVTFTSVQNGRRDKNIFPYSPICGGQSIACRRIGSERYLRQIRMFTARRRPVSASVHVMLQKDIEAGTVAREDRRPRQSAETILYYFASLRKEHPREGM